MDSNKVYRGIARSERGAATGLMSDPDVLQQYKKFSRLDVIPGTFNIKLTQPFDLNLLKYMSAAESGWADFNPADYGLENDGEVGIYYHRITVADRYPACLIIPTWAKKPPRSAEIVSPHHLRNVLNLKDGDAVEFTLDKP